MLLCDKGVLVAAGNIKDQAHGPCLRGVLDNRGPLTAVAEN
jgi:hypothetical protein